MAQASVLVTRALKGSPNPVARTLGVEAHDDSSIVGWGSPGSPSNKSASPDLTTREQPTRTKSPTNVGTRSLKSNGDATTAHARPSTMNEPGTFPVTDNTYRPPFEGQGFDAVLVSDPTAPVVPSPVWGGCEAPSGPRAHGMFGEVEASERVPGKPSFGLRGREETLNLSICAEAKPLASGLDKPTAVAAGGSPGKKIPGSKKRTLAVSKPKLAGDAKVTFSVPTISKEEFSESESESLGTGQSLGTGVAPRSSAGSFAGGSPGRRMIGGQGGLNSPVAGRSTNVSFASSSNNRSSLYQVSTPTGTVTGTGTRTAMSPEDLNVSQSALHSQAPRSRDLQSDDDSIARASPVDTYVEGVGTTMDDFEQYQAALTNSLLSNSTSGTQTVHNKDGIKRWETPGDEDTMMSHIGLVRHVSVHPNPKGKKVEPITRQFRQDRYGRAQRQRTPVTSVSPSHRQGRGTLPSTSPTSSSQHDRCRAHDFIEHASGSDLEGQGDHTSASGWNSANGTPRTKSVTPRRSTPRGNDSDSRGSVRLASKPHLDSRHPSKRRTQPKGMADRRSTAMTMQILHPAPTKANTATHEGRNELFRGPKYIMEGDLEDRGLATGVFTRTTADKEWQAHMGRLQVAHIAREADREFWARKQKRIMQRYADKALDQYQSQQQLEPGYVPDTYVDHAPTDHESHTHGEDGWNRDDSESTDPNPVLPQPEHSQQDDRWHTEGQQDDRWHTEGLGVAGNNNGTIETAQAAAAPPPSIVEQSRAALEMLEMFEQKLSYNQHKVHCKLEELTKTKLGLEKLDSRIGTSTPSKMARALRNVNPDKRPRDHSKKIPFGLYRIDPDSSDGKAVWQAAVDAHQQAAEAAKAKESAMLQSAREEALNEEAAIKLQQEARATEEKKLRSQLASNHVDVESRPWTSEDQSREGHDAGYVDMAMGHAYSQGLGAPVQGQRIASPHNLATANVTPPAMPPLWQNGQRDGDDSQQATATDDISTINVTGIQATPNSPPKDHGKGANGGNGKKESRGRRAIVMPKTVIRNGVDNISKGHSDVSGTASTDNVTVIGVETLTVETPNAAMPMPEDTALTSPEAAVIEPPVVVFARDSASGPDVRSWMTQQPKPMREARSVVALEERPRYGPQRAAATANGLSRSQKRRSNGQRGGARDDLSQHHGDDHDIHTVTPAIGAVGLGIFDADNDSDFKMHQRMTVTQRSPYGWNVPETEMEKDERFVVSLDPRAHPNDIVHVGGAQTNASGELQHALAHAAAHQRSKSPIRGQGDTPPPHWLDQSGPTAQSLEIAAGGSWSESVVSNMSVSTRSKLRHRPDSTSVTDLAMAVLTEPVHNVMLSPLSPLAKDRPKKYLSTQRNSDGSSITRPWMVNQTPPQLSEPLGVRVSGIKLQKAYTSLNKKTMHVPSFLKQSVIRSPQTDSELRRELQTLARQRERDDDREAALLEKLRSEDKERLRLEESQGMGMGSLDLPPMSRMSMRSDVASVSSVPSSENHYHEYHESSYDENDDGVWLQHSVHSSRPGTSHSRGDLTPLPGSRMSSRSAKRAASRGSNKSHHRAPTQSQSVLPLGTGTIGGTGWEAVPPTSPSSNHRPSTSGSATKSVVVRAPVPIAPSDDVGEWNVVEPQQQSGDAEGIVSYTPTDAVTYIDDDGKQRKKKQSDWEEVGNPHRPTVMGSVGSTPRDVDSTKGSARLSSKSPMIRNNRVDNTVVTATNSIEVQTASMDVGTDM